MSRSVCNNIAEYIFCLFVHAHLQIINDCLCTCCFKWHLMFFFQDGKIITNNIIIKIKLDLLLKYMIDCCFTNNCHLYLFVNRTIDKMIVCWCKNEPRQCLIMFIIRTTYIKTIKTAIKHLLGYFRMQLHA